MKSTPSASKLWIWLNNLQNINIIQNRCWYAIVENEAPWRVVVSLISQIDFFPPLQKHCFVVCNNKENCAHTFYKRYFSIKKGIHNIIRVKILNCFGTHFFFQFCIVGFFLKKKYHCPSYFSCPPNLKIYSGRLKNSLNKTEWPKFFCRSCKFCMVIKYLVTLNIE